MISATKIKKILVIRFSSLGDIILLTPLFREIKKIFPASRTDFLTSTTFADVCRGNPGVDKIIPLDRTKGFKEWAGIEKLLRRNQYDLIFDVHRSLRSRALLIKYFGVSYFLNPRILKINKRSWRRNLLLFSKINAFKDIISQRQAYCDLLKKISPSGQFDVSTELFPGEKEKQSVEKIRQKFKLTGKSLIALGPDASFNGKCWPKENYLSLSERLQGLGHQVILLGGSNDERPEWICQNSQTKPINLAGRLNFLESARLLKYCVLTISNDSAVIHFSEAVRTPAIAIFGPTVKEFGYAPFLPQSNLAEIYLSCRPCSRNGKGKCKNPIRRRCLKDIKVETVLNKALQILEKSGPTGRISS